MPPMSSPPTSSPAGLILAKRLPSLELRLKLSRFLWGSLLHHPKLGDLVWYQCIEARFQLQDVLLGPSLWAGSLRTVGSGCYHSYLLKNNESELGKMPLSSQEAGGSCPAG